MVRRGEGWALPHTQRIRDNTRVFSTCKELLRALPWEWPLAVNLSTTALFLLFGKTWLADLSNPGWFVLVLTWLFTVILVSAFAIVRHAESLAANLGEPLGTLVLTLSVTGIEVMLIAASMFTGHGSPTLARDAMFAVIMIVLNGMVGLTLLLGGVRYHEQTYNLQGAHAFLAVILPLAVLGLMLPNFTQSSPGPTFSPLQAGFFILMSIGLYSVFLAIQNSRHRHYFMSPDSYDDETEAYEAQRHPILYHVILLLAYLLPLVVLSEQLAVPIDYGIDVLHAPQALGGFLVAALVLSPESLSAGRAALANQLQRSINILLGSVLATIGLTIPAVLAISVTTGKRVILGLDQVDMLILSLTLVLSTVTFSSIRTNILLGAVHLLVFFAYLMLIFEK